MRIALVDLTYQFRGGIFHYSHLALPRSHSAPGLILPILPSQV